MKPSLIASVLIVLSATGNAGAAGFSPWSGREINDTPDAVQQSVETGSFYRSDADIKDVIDASQVQIEIGPFYGA